MAARTALHWCFGDMKIRDQELLARLRAFGSKVRGSAAVVNDTADDDADDALRLLGLPAQELTPKVRSAS